MSYNGLIGKKQIPPIPQTQPARADQIPNNAGGYAFAIDKWDLLMRFLIIGTEAGTYYVTARDLTDMNMDNVKACLAEDGKRVVELARLVSVTGRGIKNDTSILVLAAALAYGDLPTRQSVKFAIRDVCRTGTHILHFAAYADKLRGWGRSLRSTIKLWYESRCSGAQVDSLAFQMVKYQQRDGWSHKDLIRKAHPGSNDPQCAALFDWALHGAKIVKDEVHTSRLEVTATWPALPYPAIVQTFERAKTAEAADLVEMISEHNLSFEMVPSQMRTDPAVAKALALKMPLTALIRNLGNLSRPLAPNPAFPLRAPSLLSPGEEVYHRVIKLLHDREALKKARIHPISILIALRTYASGRGVRGQNMWAPVPQIIDALNDAFFLAFDAVEPIGKKIALAVDSSGSMDSPVVGAPNLTAAQASAAMALVTARTEPLYQLFAFDTQVYNWAISAGSRITDAMAIPGGGGTDVSAPIVGLRKAGFSVDSIVIYTDDETWAGGVHPYVAMEDYRRAVNKDAKLIIVATAANNLSVAAPDDPLSMTICGFDPSVPEVIRAFLSSEWRGGAKIEPREGDGQRIEEEAE